MAVESGSNPGAITGFLYAVGSVMFTALSALALRLLSKNDEQHKQHREDIAALKNQHREDIRTVFDKVDDVVDRLSHLEGEHERECTLKGGKG